MRRMANIRQRAALIGRSVRAATNDGVAPRVLIVKATVA